MAGHPWRGDLVMHRERPITQIGEHVVYMPTGKSDNRWSSRCLPAVFLGVALQSNDIF